MTSRGRDTLIFILITALSFMFFCMIWAAFTFIPSVDATYYQSGKITASGEPFTPYDMTCAAPSHVPFGSWLKVWTVGDAGEKIIYVQVNDRCKEGIDLTPTAFQKLAPLNRGRITIKYKIVD